MIQKTIHYFWDGKESEYDYKQSWIKHCPDYIIKHWNIGSLPIKKYPKLQILIDNKKYSMLSDFIRHYALFSYGGFYLDTDVELVKSLDSLRNIRSFTCIEGYPIAGNSAVCGAEKGHSFQKLALQKFFEFDFNEILSGNSPINKAPEIIVSPHMISSIIQEYKGSELNDNDLNCIVTYPNKSDFTTLPKQYFYPYNWNEQYSDNCIKDETIGIHWWKKSW